MTTRIRKTSRKGILDAKWLGKYDAMARRIPKHETSRQRVDRMYSGWEVLVTTNIQGLANYIVQQLRSTGGATVNLFGFSPDDGYMVGGVVKETVHAYDRCSPRKHAAQVADFISAHEDILNGDPEKFVGAWLNTGTGMVHLDMVHLDISERFSTPDDALDTAEERGELAIWSLHDKEEVRVS